jgi:general secretion pathway protein G
MSEQWKRFRPKRTDGRENGENRLLTYYLIFRRYEKRIAIVLGVLLVVIWGGRYLPKIGWFFRRANRPQNTRLEADNLMACVRTFLGDTGRLPAAQDGLQALTTRPASEGMDRWKGPYLYEVPRDAWGQPFVYRTNGSACAIISPGADRQLKTPDDIFVLYPDAATAGGLLTEK